MSVTIKIEPIETNTQNGAIAYVTGISFDQTDVFVGKIQLDDGSWRPARWRLLGQVRDGHPDWSLVTEQPEITGLQHAVAKLTEASRGG